MSTVAVLMFPYSGYDPGTERESLFWDMVKCCREMLGDGHTIVVLNQDTEVRGKAQAFLEDKRSQTDVEIYKVWSVDTCQMWLAGWGYVIDKYKEQTSRIVLLPGDIESISNKKVFFHKVNEFVAMDRPWDIVIGDFATGDRFNAKDLIDQYGTYALLANWFPEVCQKILQLPLNRPRSEFINIKVSTLTELLEHRKFAYEQTLNILIHSWDFKGRDWRFRIHPFQLGNLKDDSSFRQYRDCLDQIERTERMLKLLWREINEPADDSAYQEFLNHYDRLDRTSTSIRQNGRVIIRNLLSVDLD
jgi:hypothetical protein